MLLLAFSLPVLADEAVSTQPTIEQQLASIRASKIVAPVGYELTLDSRIHNLIIELCIHKAKVEPEETFVAMAKETMLPEVEGRMLTLKARQFNSIAASVMIGSTSDDTALLQLQMLSMNYPYWR